MYQEMIEYELLHALICGVAMYNEVEGASLIFDDTIIEKPYMDGNEIICWHYDHRENFTVKGINLLSAFYHSEKGGQTVRMPTGYRVIAKTEEYTDEKSGEQKRRSPVTKNQMMQEMIKRHTQNRVKFKYILAGSWFSSAENMRFIAKRKKVFIFELKGNRQATDSEMKRNQGEFGRLDKLGLPEGKAEKVWIKYLEFPVMAFKQVFKNKGGTSGQRFLATNELSLTDKQFKTLYKNGGALKSITKA